MDKTKRALKKYVDAASDLAESVKRNVQHEGVIDNKTVLALNAFIIAANELAFFTNQLDNEEDPKLQ